MELKGTHSEVAIPPDNTKKRGPSDKTTNVEQLHHHKDHEDLHVIPGGGGGHELTVDHPTSYSETLMHLLKGNIGSGMFAMGGACRNAGLILFPILTLILGVICVHSQHILLKCSSKLKRQLNLEGYPDFAETVELCFENGPPRLRPASRLVKFLVNSFLCITQIGFCCIYFVFIGSNIKQIFDYYGLEIDVHYHILALFIPILLPSLITNLKYLAPCSMFANVCMISGIGVTLYYALQDLPSLAEREFVAPLKQWPLFFGTAIFAFEGIALVLPLKNVMKNPKNFNNFLGVLNVGMLIVTALLLIFGFFGYLKWGDDVKGSLTLNLPQDDMLAQSVKIVVSIGILLTYPLQLFIAAEIMWSGLNEQMGPFKHPTLSNLAFRASLVVLTFALAELVPMLGLFISLIGAFCSTSLALVFPPVIELIIEFGASKGPSAFMILKNIIILLFAFVGFATGTYESIASLYEAFNS